MRIIIAASITFLILLTAVASLCWFYYLGPLKLAHAAVKGDIDSIKYIVNLGISPDQNAFLQGSPTNCAIANGEMAALEELYKLGANLNNPDSYGIAPLHASVIYEQDSILEWLIHDKTKSIKINLLSRDKKTALDYALEKENQNIIKLLKSKGARIAAELIIEKNGLEIKKSD